MDAAWLAATPEGAVVGFAAAHLFSPYELDEPVVELTSIVVDESQRGSGTGRALVAACEAWATEAGAIRISVATAFRRADAHAFYERLGYAQLARKYEKSLDHVNHQDGAGGGD